jgi:hypothetical protein
MIVILARDSFQKNEQYRADHQENTCRTSPGIFRFSYLILHLDSLRHINSELTSASVIKTI